MRPIINTVKMGTAQGMIFRTAFVIYVRNLHHFSDTDCPTASAAVNASRIQSNSHAPWLAPCALQAARTISSVMTTVMLGVSLSKMLMFSSALL
jgi:hypothetical protein